MVLDLTFGSVRLLVMMILCSGKKYTLESDMFTIRILQKPITQYDDRGMYHVDLWCRLMICLG